MAWAGDAAAMALLLPVLCGVIVGFSLALTGAGGSTLGVPLLLYVVGVQDPHVAIGTSALAVAVNAWAGLVPHARAGHVDWRAGIVFTVAGVVGALLASELGMQVPGQVLTVLFAALMLGVAAVMLCRRGTRAACDAGRPVRHVYTRLAGAGFGAGALAGFFGVGGGFLIVPGLMLAAHMTTVTAIGTSLLGVGSFGLATALNYAWSGLVDWQLAALFVLGGIAGSWLGVVAVRRLSARRRALEFVFAAVIIAVAVSMLAGTLPGLL